MNLWNDLSKAASVEFRVSIREWINFVKIDQKIELAMNLLKSFHELILDQLPFYGFYIFIQGKNKFIKPKFYYSKY